MHITNNAEKASDKIQCLLMIKALGKIGTEGNLHRSHMEKKPHSKHHTQ